MDNQSAVFSDAVDTEARGPYRLVSTSAASAHMASLAAPRRSWTLPSGEVPLGYLPRQVLHTAQA